MALIDNEAPVTAAAVEAAEANKATAAAAAMEEDKTAAAAVAETTAQPAAQVSPAAAAASTSTEVTAAPAAASTVAVRQAGQSAAVQKLAMEGFEVKLDFSSYVNVVLKDGEFPCSNGKIISPDGFKAIISGSRNKYVVKEKGANDDDDAEVLYTYDRNDVNNPATPAGQMATTLRAEGKEVEVKDYTEVYAQMVEASGKGNEELAGEMVVIQIPPTSMGRFGGYVNTQLLKLQRTPDKYITHFGRGEKVTKVKFPFYPWAFKLDSVL